MALLQSHTITLSDGKAYTFRTYGAITFLKKLDALVTLFKGTPIVFEKDQDGKVIYSSEWVCGLLTKYTDLTLGAISILSDIPVSEFSEDQDHFLTLTDILDICNALNEVNDFADFFGKLLNLVGSRKSTPTP